MQLALTFLAIRIAASFPHSLYQAVFIGTQRQVLGNVIGVSGAALAALLAVAAVLIWRDVAALCTAEALATLVLISAQRIAVLRILPRYDGSSRFSWSDLAAQWMISAGVMWTSGSGVLITQMDRLLIARWLPVAMLAVYNAASAGAKFVWIIYGPFLTAVYPQTCQIASINDRKALTGHILRNARVIAALCMSFGLYLCFHAKEILWLWTRNHVIASEGSSVMVLYILGNIAQSYASVFYMLQTAKGMVRYPALFNAIALAWYPFALAALTPKWGLAGAAACWLIYCGLTLALLAAVSFRQLLERAAWRPYAAMLAWTSLTGCAFMIAARILARFLHIETPFWRLAFGAPFSATAFLALAVGTIGWSDMKRHIESLWRVGRPSPI